MSAPRRTPALMTGGDLRAARHSLRWSQSDAAAALGVSSPARISDWERDIRPIPPYIASSVRAHLRAVQMELDLEAGE